MNLRAFAFASRMAPFMAPLMSLLVALCIGLPCRAQGNGQVAEHQVKAAFLYKFLGFVDWPAQAFSRADAPLVIGVMGADVLAAELALAVANRQVNGRLVVARRLKAGDSIAGLHMLFVGQAEESRVAALAASAKGQPLLIVTDSEDGLIAGSSINFVMVDNKVRFDVAPHRAEEANLKISSRLLAVARRVISDAARAGPARIFGGLA